MIESSSRIIWIGTSADGLLSFDKHTEAFHIYQHDPQNPNSLSNNWIWSIIEDRNGFLWIGTNNGLNKFDPERKTFIHYKNNPHDENSLSSNRVYYLLKPPAMLVVSAMLCVNSSDKIV